MKKRIGRKSLACLLFIFASTGYAASQVSCDELAQLWSLNGMTMYKSTDGGEYRLDEMTPKSRDCLNSKWILFSTSATDKKVNGKIIIQMLAEKTDAGSCKLMGVQTGKEAVFTKSALMEKCQGK